jgi:hypothetical protein
LQFGLLIPQLTGLGCERVSIDLFKQSKVEQLLLKSPDFGVPFL